MADQTEFGRDRSAGIHGKPSGLGGSYRGRRDWIGGALVSGWMAHDVEIEFMIDTGCQVTILSATVFQRMCVVKPEVRSALQVCRRRLVSADSSPLTVQGQLELDIVFPDCVVRQLLRDLLLRYRHVFPAPGEPVTGRTSAVQHDIVTMDARPVRCGPRWLAPAGLRKEQTCVRKMLEGGQIEPSNSPWASPIVLVMKKDGSTRFCVDYRRLNALTTKDAYPLPRIDESLRLLGNQQWFSTMDLASGYWQVAMSPEAKRKAVFVTNEGLFQFRVMPFGLCNAPATFERLMDRVLCGMRWSRSLVYLDDVISFGGSVTEALGRLEEVLCSNNFGLQLKAKKCTFMQTEVVFLGHIVGRTGLACDPTKLIAVQNWHAPDKVKGV